LNAVTNREIAIKRAKMGIFKFILASHARFCLQRSLRAMPKFIDYWGLKAKKVREMVKLRREFLTQVVARELRIMMAHY